MSSRLERAIAKLRDMSHEEYEALINRHSSSEDMRVSFPHINSLLIADSYIIAFQEAYPVSPNELSTQNIMHILNNEKKIGASFEAPIFHNIITLSETYQDAA